MVDGISFHLWSSSGVVGGVSGGGGGFGLRFALLYARLLKGKVSFDTRLMIGHPFGWKSVLSIVALFYKRFVHSFQRSDIYKLL